MSSRNTRSNIFWFVVIGIPLIAANWACFPHIHEAFDEHSRPTVMNVFTYLLFIAECLIVGSFGLIISATFAYRLFRSAHEWFVDDRAPHWYIRRQAKKTNEKRRRVANKQRIADELSKRADTDIHRMVEATSELREAEAELEEFLATKGQHQ